MQVSYPGVYVQEIPSSVRPIAAVSTSVGAFIDFFPEGDTSRAVQIFGMADFERNFGRVTRDSAASYQISQFFLNGGPSAWIVRVAPGAKVSSVGALPATGTTAAITLEAKNGGTWGDALRFVVEPVVDPSTGAVSTTLFDLYVSRYASADDRRAPMASERYLGVSTAATSSRYFVRVVNAASQLVTAAATTADAMPTPTGTLSGPIVFNGGTHFKLLDGAEFKASIGATTVTCSLVYKDDDADPRKLRAAVEAAIRKAGAGDPGLAGATVKVIGDRLLITTANRTPKYNPHWIITIAAGGTTSVVDRIGFNAAGAPTNNVQEYRLGDTSTPGKQKGGLPGSDGGALTATALIGDAVAKTGMYALEDADLFNLLCLPGAVDLTSGEFTSLMSAAVAYVEKRRAFLLVDIPELVNTPQKAQDWVDANASSIKSANTAVYFPRVELPDPTDEYRLRSMPSSGTLAGIYARTDTERGVWKAPAGIDTHLRGVGALDYLLSDGENGVLNLLGIDCLRVFPVYGQVAWGARTTLGADAMASEWKYVPIRRLALMIEESLFRGTKWVVFEPNDEPLWAKIRQNVGAFMMGLFRQGAFQGGTPDKAFFVKCDGETTTAADRNLGIVNIEVGFAPLKPAEFVVIKLQQIPDLT